MKKLWRFLNVYIGMVLFMTAAAVAMLFVDIRAFIAVCAAAFLSAVIAILESLRVRKKLRKYIDAVSAGLVTEKGRALRDMTIPVIVTTSAGEIVWYNNALENTYNEAQNLISKNLNDIASDEVLEQLSLSRHAEITLGGKIYKIYKFSVGNDANELCSYMLFNVTSHRKLKQQYLQSRPVVAIVDIDNFEEITRTVKDADAAATKSAIHNAIEKWGSVTKGIMRRIYGDRYMIILDERDVQKLIEDKFSILESIKEIRIGENFPTLSIGVGRMGETLGECEEYALQALEMAQSRGGDQAAVKSNGQEYQFFGGVAAATAKHTRARARVVASAVKELIKAADNVVIMGHKYADLDSLGSAYGIYKLARSMEKETYVVYNEQTSMAKNLYERLCSLNEDFKGHIFQDVRHEITKKTLLIITDVHRAQVTEDPELIKQCGPLVIIDHHRKAVDFIDGSVIFYNETAASSASEMVTELLQYANPKAVTQAEAEALLSGIMLDSRNFVMNSGVRTFEAAAFLRSKGADPIQVKKLFSGSIGAYKQRANIVASAEIYGNTAIAVNEENDQNTRLATAQAADELLGVSKVAASFVLCRIDGGKINISARSLGQMNVQLIMEALGGGGHRTMAACQLDESSFDKATEMLRAAIDEYKKNTTR
ncbi:MAG: DHH family phosphoesterase [Clostridia bacterium]|nr:DHH family phosphoesterase [Clostridia bacterium]